MPGLTDMHIHMRMDPQAAFNLFLANGVTTVFNMGLADRNGDFEIDHLQLRDDVAAEPLENYLKAYFFHADRMSDPEYRAPAVRDVAESGIYVDPTLTIYEYILRYVSDDLFAELQSDERLVYLPKRTRDEYMNPETNEYRTGFAGLLGKSLGGQDAVVNHAARNMETFSALLFEMHEAGVPLLLGTDLFGAVVPGFSVHQELELMVDAGLTPYEALRTGTVNVAAYLGEINSAGTWKSENARILFWLRIIHWPISATLLM